MVFFSIWYGTLERVHREFGRTTSSVLVCETSGRSRFHPRYTHEGTTFPDKKYPFVLKPNFNLCIKCHQNWSSCFGVNTTNIIIIIHSTFIVAIKLIAYLHNRLNIRWLIKSYYKPTGSFTIIDHKALFWATIPQMTKKERSILISPIILKICAL